MPKRAGKHSFHACDAVAVTQVDHVRGAALWETLDDEK